MSALTAVKPKTRYAVPPPSLRNLLVSMLPKRMVDNRIARRFGLERPSRRAEP